LTIDSAVYDAYATITRFGAVSAVDQINLTNQVTGQLANSNVSGLGALALLNTVNLNTQVTGALNGLTQVTNLGNLAYANAIAANQIGAGTLAAGVIYAGLINASQVNAGVFTGLTFQTSASNPRVVIDSSANAIMIYGGGSEVSSISPNGSIFAGGSGVDPTVHIFRLSGSQPALRVSGPPGVPGMVVAQPFGGPSSTPIRLDPCTSLPTSRDAGSICFYNGWLCFADGSHWYQSNGIQLT